MHKVKGIIALDLDGTLLNSEKELSDINRAALESAALSGYEIVPTTGRFYGGMPEVIRKLPFVNYAITINGAEAAELGSGKVIYKSEIPWQQAVDIMEWLDTFPVIYDCYMDGKGWMTASQKEKIDEIVESPHYRKMLHELRQNVPELKNFLCQRGQDVQKVQFFTNQPELRLKLMEELPKRFDDLAVSSSVSQNVEINQKHANKGEALLALAKYLDVDVKNTYAFGDGLNDISMINAAGVGIAMENAEDEVKAHADCVTKSCDEHGVAAWINTFCLK